MLAIQPPVFHTRVSTFALVAGLTLGSASTGQAPPGQETPTRTAVLDKVTEARVLTRLNLGKAALGAGQFQAARDHYLSALPHGPADARILTGLLETATAAKDADARIIWAIRLYQAMADERGRARIGKSLNKLWPKGEKAPATLALARTNAVAELARFVAKKRRGRTATGSGVLVRWASDLAWQLMQDAPGLQGKYAGVFRQATAAEVADYQTVLKALEKVAAGSIKPKPAGQENEPTAAAVEDAIVRASRCLTGMGAQARFKDRRGPKPPDVSRIEAVGRAARGKVRNSINQRVGAPLTLDQLAQMSKAEAEEFTKTHATWASPGIAISPTGKYQIRTICGYNTLIGAVETIEFHHARLVNWYGKDPFEGRQGTVRIVPASEGLESEGAPFWWAGGFQSGDLTTVKFNWNNVGSLGRLLTHELTHRFDGRLLAFLPSFAVEGRAVWTADSYGMIQDDTFRTNKLSLSQCTQAFVSGYGRARNLQRLIEGTIDDYRDNYTAGYALFAYLASWTDGSKPLYAAQLDQYLQNARAGRSNPVKWFSHCFADGKNGRPADFESFAREFRSFLNDCYQWGWDPRNRAPAWANRYRVTPLRGRRRSLVEDEPTWVWNRNRAEPWFGQRHAADAGKLLQELGEDRAAIAALLWSVGVDDWQSVPAAMLATLLDRTGYPDSAWIVRLEMRRRGQFAPAESPGPAPTLRVLPRVAGYLAALRKVASELHSSKRTTAARELLGTHNELAKRVGVPASKLPAPAEVPGMFGPSPVHARPLGLYGLTESDLTGFEDRRSRGLWYEADNGDLHVGRKKPRDKSGLIDRRAHQRHAFVHTAEWFGPEPYVFKTKVHFTTSFVRGAIILGWTRRDRNIRLGFSAGDFLYSVGRKGEAAKTQRIQFSMQDLWRRQKYFPGWRVKPFRFDKQTSHFDLEVRVDGARAEVFIEGQPYYTYTTPDRSPIRGAVGVAMSQGAVRLQDPVVRSWPSAPRGVEDAANIGMLYGRALPGVPTFQHGTVAVWLPIDGGDDEAFEYERWTKAAIERLEPMLEDKLRYPQKWVVMMPSTLSAEDKKAIHALASQHGMEVAEHKIDKPLTESIFGLYVDPWGGVRTSNDLLREGVGVPKKLRDWARRSRRPR
ncbi:MAG: hypothetical protein VX951_03695 [Planctomycetota bacterium]|nr:hypothetical protein [Planctomycetota bacterium]